VAVDCVAMLHGGLTRTERRSTVEEFQSGRKTILLATDAGGEGLNLHRTCRVVVNLELPWNPMRLEQRVGRVDRIGQGRRVHAFNLIAHDSGEARILGRLKARLARARQDIDVPDPLALEIDDETEAFAIAAMDPEGSMPSSATAAVGNVVARSAPGTPGSASPDTAETRRSHPRLSSAATAEHRRLLWTRAVLESAPPSTGRSPCNSETDPGGGPWLAFARHPTTRARLSPAILVLLRPSLTDDSGRVVWAEVVPLRVDPARAVGRAAARATSAAMVEWLESSWRAVPVGESVWIHERFWDTRVARECAIADLMRRSARAAVQLGLFDRRDVDEADAGATLEKDLARRIARMDVCRSLEAARTQVALILIP
jgi:hypothetical protein